MENKQILGIKSLREHNKQHPFKLIRDILELDWIFSTKIEKILLLGCVFFTTYSVGKFLWSLI